MKRILVLLLAVTLIVCSAGCNRVQSPYLQDYDQLWQDLYENYPFFPILEQQGIDVDAIRTTYREYAVNANSTEEFMKTLDLMFAKLYCFAHLSLIHRDTYDILVESEGLRDPSQFAPWSALLHDPVTAHVYSTLPPAEASAQMNESLVTCSYYEEIRAAYFQFPAMNANNWEQDEVLIADYLSQLPDVEHIIIDVTGNYGGSTLYWKKVIVKPFGGEWSAKYPILYQDSTITKTFYSQNNLKHISELHTPPAFAEKLHVSYYSEGGWAMDCGEATLSNGANAKRWVLTDGRGYSATEAFAAFCKLTGWAELVGSRTSGDGLGGQPVLLQLKNTGLLVYFSAAMAANPDGTLNTMQGVQPDHSLLPKDYRSPLELCMDLISQDK